MNIQSSNTTNASRSRDSKFAFRYSNFRRFRRSRRAAGFSILELLVAVAITVLLLALVSTVLTPVRQMVTIATANMELSNYASALEATLRDDFRRLNRDQFMVIKTQVIGIDETADSTVSPWERHNADQLLFFAAGPWTSQRFHLSQNQNVYDTGVSRTFRASEARVWYGHLAGDASGSDPTASTGSTDFVRWALGRQALLLTPAFPAQNATVATHKVGAQTIWTINNPAAAAVPATYPIYDGSAPFTTSIAATSLQYLGIMQGTVDTTAGHTSADARNVIMNATSAPSGFPGSLAAQATFTAWNNTAGSGSVTAQRDRMSSAAFRIYGQSTFTAGGTLDRDAVMRTHAVIAPNCSEFKVEFAGDYDATYLGVDVNTATDGSGTAAGNPATATLPTHWYGGYSSTGARKITGNTNIDRFEGTDTSATAYGKYTAVFGFDRGVTPWPRLVRVTVRLQDARGALHDMYINTGGPAGAAGAIPDGRVYQFVLEVPQ